MNLMDQPLTVRRTDDTQVGTAEGLAEAVYLAVDDAETLPVGATCEYHVFTPGGARVLTCECEREADGSVSSIERLPEALKGDLADQVYAYLHLNEDRDPEPIYAPNADALPAEVRSFPGPDATRAELLAFAEYQRGLLALAGYVVTGYVNELMSRYDPDEDAHALADGMLDTSDRLYAHAGVPVGLDADEITRHLSGQRGQA